MVNIKKEESRREKIDMGSGQEGTWGIRVVLTKTPYSK